MKLTCLTCMHTDVNKFEIAVPSFFEKSITFISWSIWQLLPTSFMAQISKTPTCIQLKVQIMKDGTKDVKACETHARKMARAIAYQQFLP
jgi:hypothetical protein